MAIFSSDSIRFAAAILLLTLNLLGILLCGIDKRKAKRGLWRIPEKTFFLLALVGGSAGVLAGMYLFSHKTRHLSFTIGIPLILILQIAALVYFTFFAH